MNADLILQLNHGNPFLGVDINHYDSLSLSRKQANMRDAQECDVADTMSA